MNCRSKLVLDTETGFFRKILHRPLTLVKNQVSKAYFNYDISDIFLPFPLRNRLYNILQILNNIGSAIAPQSQ